MSDEDYIKALEVFRKLVKSHWGVCKPDAQGAAFVKLNFSDDEWQTVQQLRVNAREEEADMDGSAAVASAWF